MAFADSALLGTFQKHIEDMQGLIHCKICLKPFYEPFTLACGHTYCYSCLSGWVNGPHNRREDKNCPDCRKRITTEPSPNYTLRDLVHMFCNRVELLPEDETLKEHEEGKAAEAKVLMDDKKGPGLFKGRFTRSRPVFGLGRIMRDVADGVDRCPDCMWELEEGICNSCGWPQHSDMSDDDSDGSLEDHMVRFDETDYDSENDYRDVSPVDQFGGPVDIPILPTVLRPDAFSDNGSNNVDGRQSPNYYSLDEGEHDSEMEDFIDDTDYPEEVDHDDNESVHTANAYNATSPAAQYSTDDGGVTTDYDEDEDDEPIPVQRYRSIAGRRQTPISIDIDAEQESDSESETTAPATHYENDTASEAQTAEDDSKNSDDSSVQEISPPTAVARGRKRRVIESEEETAEDDSEQSDDTAIRAPRSTAARRQRLNARRASNTLQAARRASGSQSPQRSTSTGSWARRGGGEAGIVRGRGGPMIPRRGQPYTRVH